MAELKTGDVIHLINGKTCTIICELGRGGQGIVYKVNYDGGEYALKWYIQKYKDAFYDNLKSNVEIGAPNDHFLWPIALSNREKGSFGYIMKLRPAGYEEVGSFILVKTRFSSIDALINAAMQICTAFQQLHIKGLSYQDMNDGNFFINPHTGDVLICDNDNVAPDRINMGIVGKTGYMAPEIVEKETMPNRHSDYFSLAVVLFILFYMNRPFDGLRATRIPCFTEEAERKLYGKNCVFIMDPNDTSNHPVAGLHTNVIRRWPLFPRVLREAFIKTFSKEAIQNPMKRVIDKEWQVILTQLRSQWVQCPHCGRMTFLDLSYTATKCIECGNPIVKPKEIKVGNYNIPILPGQKIYSSQISYTTDLNKVAGTVIVNKNDGVRIGIHNISGEDWTVTTASGTTHIVHHEGAMPVLADAQIRFNKNFRGRIIN